MDFQHILDNIFLSLNEYRMHPNATTKHIKNLEHEFQGRLFKNKYNTREGVTALHDLIQDFSKRRPINQRLKWSFALHMAADEQATMLGQKGLVTTEGTSHYKSLPDRVQEFAIVRGRLSEVYEFGGKTAEQILEELLIDDGLVSRKRRSTLMDPIFSYIGIGTSYHESHEACTVIILAEDIISLVAPDISGKYKKRKGLKTGEEITVKVYEDIFMGNNNSIVNQNNNGNESRFLLSEANENNRDTQSQQRMTKNQIRAVFDEQSYLSRQKDRDVLTYQGNRNNSNTNVNADRFDGEENLVIRDTVQNGRIPEPVAPVQNTGKKDSKCSLM